MKTLTYIQLTAAIFAVVLFDTTTQVTLLLNVLRPVEDVLSGILSTHLGKSYGIQQIQSAVDIYLKAKQVNGEISKEDAYVVSEVLRLCQQDRSLFDILSHTNRCTLTDIQEALHLIVAKLGKPAFYQDYSIAAIKIVVYLSESQGKLAVQYLKPLPNRVEWHYLIAAIGTIGRCKGNVKLRI